jgi:hypothetical protein
MKKIAANLSFKYKNELVVLQDILIDIIDELRRDRKIKMAIQDSEYVKEYIMEDLEEAEKMPEEQ